MNAQKQELAEMKAQIQKVEHICKHVEQHAAICSGCEVLIFTDYRKNKINVLGPLSREFSSPQNEYTFKIIVKYYKQNHNDIGVFLVLVNGKIFPATFNVRLELLNQAGNHHHVVRCEKLHLKKIVLKMRSKLMKA